MATQQQVRSLSIGPSSDLVVGAAWRPGVIQADELILPRVRLALTFRAVFTLRKTAREALPTVAFADPIERLEQIHSFRFAAEPGEMRLAVTFDFGWESYMRALWGEAGPFLDLLCCHCADYRLARNTPLHEWQQWVRDHQRPSDYFYSATGLTVGDLAALSQAERIGRDQGDGTAADRLLAGFCSRSAVDLSRETRMRAPQEAVRQAIRVIGTMYRLTRYWGADVTASGLREDAVTLIRATRGMIEDSFVQPGSFPGLIEQDFATELAWYRQKADADVCESAAGRHNPANVQHGILTGFDAPAPITHGAAVFLGITDPGVARKTLAGLVPSHEPAPGTSPAPGTIFRNLAFTYRGLQRLQLAPELLAEAPTAFRDGAAMRAGTVGDLRGFHPSHWQPLRRNWRPQPDQAVALDQVHLLVQLRVAAGEQPFDPNDPLHPLHAEITRLANLPGLELLAVEGLTPASPGGQHNHLGFADGVSQPVVDGPETHPWSDSVPPGALLVGRGAAPAGPFWRDGSFLAVRRMPVDRARFEAMVTADCAPRLGDPVLLAAKLVGRHANGNALAAQYGANNFTYEGDEGGAICPLDSHVRRANPRQGRPPRIMRRGMSFGPPAASAEPGERGTFFMAYCADLAEQYERVLGWVNGGNSTRAGSYLGDPLAGAPTGAEGRTYRFLHAGAVHRVKLPDPLRGVASLSWSLYLFAPSLSAIASLATVKAEPEPQPSAERGEAIIARLQGKPAELWQAALSGPDAQEFGGADALWAAIRERHGGILFSPAGYLVGSYALVIDILRDDGRRFTNAGAGARADATIGKFHLGMDGRDPAYKIESKPANAALETVTDAAAFDLTRAATREIIARRLKAGTMLGLEAMPIDLVKDVIEPALAHLGQPLFDLPDGDEVIPGSQDWTSPATRKLRWPGDFWAPSRYTFYPYESDETERLAVAQGKASVAAVMRAIDRIGRTKLKGQVSGRLAAARTAYPTTADLARVLVGCMVGAVPTVAGNAARTLVGMLENGTFDQAQRAWLKARPAGNHAAARACFDGAIDAVFLRNPVPELLWRTVNREKLRFGGLVLPKGALVVFSLESASRDQIGRGIHDRAIPFGRAVSGKPTVHGCPGHAMANGIILGLIAGMAESGRFSSTSHGTAELRALP